MTNLKIFCILYNRSETKSLREAKMLTVVLSKITNPATLIMIAAVLGTIALWYFINEEGWKNDMCRGRVIIIAISAIIVLSLLIIHR